MTDYQKVKTLLDLGHHVKVRFDNDRRKVNKLPRLGPSMARFFNSKGDIWMSDRALDEDEAEDFNGSFHAESDWEFWMWVDSIEPVCRLPRFWKKGEKVVILDFVKQWKGFESLSIFSQALVNEVCEVMYPSYHDLEVKVKSLVSNRWGIYPNWALSPAEVFETHRETVEIEGVKYELNDELRSALANFKLKRVKR